MKVRRCIHADTIDQPCTELMICAELILYRIEHKLRLYLRHDLLAHQYTKLRRELEALLLELDWIIE